MPSPGHERRIVMAVIGAGQCDAQIEAAAHEIGRLIAERGAILVTGGHTGVMEAASRGASEAGGLVVGILPGLDRASANRFVDVAIPSGMGQLRNGLIVNAADAVIAVGGEWGTLSEIGFALKADKPVIGWKTWELSKRGERIAGPTEAKTPAEAVKAAFASCSQGSRA